MVVKKVEQINRGELKQFLKKMKFTFTIEEALNNESCIKVFSAYCENLLKCQDKTDSGKSDTKIESWEQIKLELGDRQSLVLDYIKNNPKSTRSQLTALINQSGTPIKHSSVTARCTELLDLGFIKVDGTVFDAITKRNVETLSFVEVA